jgi:hypothetical protein
VGSRILVLYGSYRTDRKGNRLADFAVHKLRDRGEDAELIDAKAIGLPMLDRMLKEYAPGTAPAAMEKLGAKIREADAFLFVAGEYNWGMQPGLTNLTTSSKSGTGALPRLRAIRQADCPALGQAMPGTTHSPRWGWWSSQVR